MIRFSVLIISLIVMNDSVASEVSRAQLALWTESTPFTELERRLPEFKNEQISLHVAVHESDRVSEDFIHFYRKAQTLGVQVRPWLLLTKAHGYWINKWNLEFTEKFVRKFISEMHAHGLSVNWLTFDIEPPADLMHQLEKCGKNKDIFALLKNLKESSRNGKILHAQLELKHLVEALQSEGIRVHAVTTPLVLHDLGNQEMRIQSALGVPFQAVPWDEVSFMVYREEYIRMVGEIGGDVVYQYGKLASGYFREKAALDLGEVGSAVYPDIFTGYTHPDQLRTDLQAGLASGISKFHIYSLEGFTSLSGENLTTWLQVPSAKIPPRDWKARVLIWTLRAITALLPPGN